MSTPDKDTIYIDIDDEITGIIDKLKASEGKVVALVLPKRAAVFQSIVNMKLLKRAADSAKKNPVLITGEAGLLPLAGMAGVHVAKTLTSKPEVPAAPAGLDDSEESVQEDDDATDTPLDPQQPVGKLAGPAAVSGGVETLVLDDEAVPPEVVADSPLGAKSFEPTKKPKNKKLKIPNFERFRLLLALGGLILILLIGGLVFATLALPKATITIKTDATNVNANLNLNLSPSAKTLDASSGTLPAKLDSQQKTYTQQATTTGQKNNGNKASGSINMSAQECGNVVQAQTVPAGTGVSSNGQTYITQEDTTFSPKKISNNCITFQSDNNTTIIAQTGGASYNGATSFSVAGRNDVSASVSSAIAGGTDNIVQIVNQNDINSAKSKIAAASDAEMKQALSSDLQKNAYYPIPVTYVAGTPAVTSSANVGDVASSVTVTENINYTMFGVYQNDLQTLLDNNIKSQIDTSKQVILDDGLSSAVMTANNVSSSVAQVSLSTKGVAGPDLSAATIKQQASGQRIGAVKSQLQANPDVTSVDIKLSPFWISTIPKKTDRIIVNIAKPVSTKSNSNGSQP